ncbi:cell division protein FtsQ/DivIB [Nocardioides sp. MAHUQ-72]|uniref:cell division protein FtsQ/DivIB n=1 Tax=unclassified Nocardioides TaxID=2615069 RepID=UPI00360EA864
MRSSVRRRDGAGPAGDRDALRTRRRFARRQWARRWLTWKYVVGLVVVLGLLATGVWAVWFSSLLAVQGVQVTGAPTLGTAQIRKAAAVPTGEPLATLDLGGVQARVESLAGVRSADVSRQWPDEVLITVHERVAIAVVEIGGRVRGMDDAGVVFRDYQHPPADLPRVQTSTETHSDALQEAARVISALPSDLATKVDHVEVETVDQISLVLGDGRRVVWGSADESEEKAQVLAALLPHRHQEYDVSVPGQPTTTG